MVEAVHRSLHFEGVLLEGGGAKDALQAGQRGQFANKVVQAELRLQGDQVIGDFGKGGVPDRGHFLAGVNGDDNALALVVGDVHVHTLNSVDEGVVLELEVGYAVTFHLLSPLFNLKDWCQFLVRSKCWK